jgi:uncharacterized membrane protein
MLKLTNKTMLAGSASAVILYGASLAMPNILGTFCETFFGLICGLILPGFLLQRWLRIRTHTLGEELLYSLGLSIALLFGVGLLVNTLLPLLGIMTPLDPSIVQVSLLVLNSLLLGIAYFTRVEISIEQIMSRRFKQPSLLTVALYVVPVIFVGLSIIGAISLNNNGTNAYALAALLLAVVYGVVLLVQRKTLPVSVYPYTLFMLCLMILLMTSLRGWTITGHDILLEYHVFELTKEHLHWSMAYFQDAYNACLSITMLPTMLSGILPHVGDQYILRVIFQVVFATMPVAVYYLVNRFFSAKLAFIAAVFFIAQVPVLRDLPFMARQEIAFFFYALIALVMVNQIIKPWQRNALFSIFGVSMVLSHYSTVYLALAIFLMALVFKASFVRNAFGKLKGWVSPLLRRVEKYGEPLGVEQPVTRITKLHLPGWPVVIVLIGFILIWNMAITGTANNLQKFAASAYNDLIHGTSAHEATSGAANQFNLFKKPQNTEDLVTSFNKKTNTPTDTTQGTHFTPDVWEDYDLHIDVDSVLKPVIDSDYVNAIAIVGEIVKNAVKLLMLLGILWLVFVGLKSKIEAGLKAVLVANLFVFGVILLLPIISVNYDVMRAYQQLLVFLCIPAIVGSCVLMRALSRKLWYSLTVFIFSAYFTFVSALTPQLFGFGEIYLPLNNRGPYYNMYYVHESEVASINWLSQHGNAGYPTYADWFAGRKLATFGTRNIWIVSNVLPKNITHESYVYVGVTNKTLGAAYVFYEGHELPYRFPTQFLQSQKNTIYSNGSSEILQ